MSDWIEAAPGAFYNLDQIEALRKVGGNVRIAFVSGAIIVIGDPPEDCAEALLRAVEERAREAKSTTARERAKPVESTMKWDG